MLGPLPAAARTGAAVAVGATTGASTWVAGLRVTDLVAALDVGPVEAGAGGLLMLLFGYLFRELRRKDDGVWRIIDDRDKLNAQLAGERDWWRAKAMGEDPGPFPIPTLAVPTPPATRPHLEDVVDDVVGTVRRRRRRP